MTGWLRSARRRIAGIALLAGLAGCADRAPAPPPPSPAPVTAAPSGPVQVDGTYIGMKQLVRGADGPGLLCGAQDPIRITVSNRTFRYVLQQPEVPFDPTRSFDVTIRDDGTFRATDGPAFIDGSAGDGHMQGEISGDACGYAFAADRRG